MAKPNNRGLGLDYVKTPRLAEILDMIEELRGTHGRSDSDCMMISGPPGAGKTSLLNHFGSKRQPEPSDEADIRPIVYSRMPTQCTRRALAANILGALGVEPPGQCDEADLTEMILAQLKGQQTELLIIEDMHRICAEKKGYKAANLIADLLEDGPTPIVIAGLTEVERMLEVNDSIRRRLTFAVKLKPLNWFVEEQKAEFKNLLKLLKRSWKYPCADVDFDDDDYCGRVSWAHGGLIGNVVQHMKRTEKEVSIAIRRGKEGGRPRAEEIFKSDVAATYLKMRMGGQTFKQFEGNDDPFDEENVLLPRKWALASMYEGW